MSDALTAKLAKDLKASIIQRSKAGIDAEGKQMKPLADGSKADLTETGRLLDSLKTTVSSKGTVVIEPTVGYAKYVQAIRPFMGISPKEAEIIDDFTRAFLADMEKRSNSGGR